MKKKIDPEEPIARLFASVSGLGRRLGPVLYQLPPSLKIDLPRLDRFLCALPRSSSGSRLHVVEFRHPSWYVAETFELLTFFFHAEDGIRDGTVTGVQTCALPISAAIRAFFLPVALLAVVEDAIAAEVVLAVAIAGVVGIVVAVVALLAVVHDPVAAVLELAEIGRASCREMVLMLAELQMDNVELK